MKEKSRVVWVFGGSASGKERFIKYINQMRPPALIKRLGWEEGILIVCNESLDWMGVKWEDENTKKREALPTIIASLITKKSSIILIKGQDIDLRNNILKKTKELLPDATHEIIFLHIPINAAFKRWKEKPWKKFWYSKYTVKHWLNYQLNQLKKIEKMFPITALDSSDDDYKKILFPPKIKLR